MKTALLIAVLGAVLRLAAANAQTHHWQYPEEGPAQISVEAPDGWSVVPDGGLRLRAPDGKANVLAMAKQTIAPPDAIMEGMQKLMLGHGWIVQPGVERVIGDRTWLTLQGAAQIEHNIRFDLRLTVVSPGCVVVAFLAVQDDAPAGIDALAQQALDSLRFAVPPAP